MSNESLQRSLLPNNPVDPSIVRVLRALDPIAREGDCSYFVAGATARDLILVNIHDLRPGRATRDIDFGIAVENWGRFALLKKRLTATGVFTSDQRAQQRLTYSDQTTGFSIPVDLIPFRGVTAVDSTIAWPPSRDTVLNVAGFEEALASSIPIQIEDDLIVRVASIPGLMILKLVAWSDRRHETDKDAADIYRLLTSYADAGNTDRLYENEMNLLEAVGFEMELAGAELLGRDVAQLSSPPALVLIRSVLEAEPTFESLLNHIVRTSAIAEAAPFVERMLSCFRNGLLINR
ncbi:MAG TPA: nucleotidyl transferase AbiEii/AbiGii toxin family protein [Candidatus Limnocylindrales bacterium]|nr:nucleotidyl transferase AbiEii/AbiGii toxin family protein [Candidatus Limnocylindrales bacterium]